MNTSILRTPAAKAMIVLALVFATTAAHAQRSAEERRNARQSQSSSAKAPEEQYPDATRKVEAKGSPRMGQRLQRMIDAYNKPDFEAAEKQIVEILAAENATAYDKALASRIRGAILMETDPAAALQNFEQVIELDGLNNNDHYEVMWYVAQLQGQENQFAESLATIDRLMSETSTSKAEHLGFKGQILYQMERYQEAADVLTQAIAATDEPQAQWQQLLMASYAESGQGAKAIETSAAIAAAKPDDVVAQRNLAGLYIQNEQDDKAIEIYERLRAAGQLKEEADYRNLVAMYLGKENSEQKAIDIMNEGLESNILKPSAEMYALLGQAYYFSDQLGPAIEAYKKAAPLAADGEAFLNLAKVLWAEGRIPEAKQAAQQALDKGIKAPQEAQNILKL